MNWIDKYNVTVPCYEVIGSKIFFVIKLMKNEKGVCAPVVTLSSSNEVLTTLRSYSQFRHLWKTLRERLNEPLETTRRYHPLTFNLVQTCHCAQDHCVFDALHPILQSFAFPSRRSLRSKLSGLDHIAINARRNALSAFVTLVQDFFSTFASVALQDINCLVLKTYVDFLDAAKHFPIDVSAALHRPLVLSGWRQQCVNRGRLGQDKDDGKTIDSVPELSEVYLTAPSNAVEPRIAEDSTSLLSERDEEKLERPLLLALEVKTVRIHTMHSFMEEFCEQVLSQFASDIDELDSPEFTQTRRWEICLYMACRIGHTYAVQLILLNYADANTALADGSSCLNIAARMGRIEIVALLIEEGASVNKANEAGVTPLVAACRNGCLDIVKMLLDAGAEVSACSKRGTYPLHAAIVSQNIEIVSMLVDRGANVNVMTASGITPLHFAAKLGAVALSEYLLRHDADLEKRTKDDSDAMMVAEANGHTTICELIQRFSVVVSSEQVGSDPHQQERQGSGHGAFAVAASFVTCSRLNERVTCKSFFSEDNT
ncbi:unnamed protein product [Peronospora farinosa]|uniref:PX domain-containing protein n=1 Tax=Peronospora farinosa TaxID=134698 RepID=A0AAV0UAB3_9STRA|nr:unnamed protein product [Peronospora farinosa]CAI5732141.1 unnamed protein product [Peronospora farinosa]